MLGGSISLVRSFGMTLLMHYLILWATSGIRDLPTTRLRIAGAAFLASMLDFGVIFLLAVGAIPMPPAVLLALASMIPAALIAFGWPSFREYSLAVGYVYVISVVGGGGAYAASYLTGGNELAAFVAAIGTVLLMAELGWGLVHRKVREWLLYVPIEIRFGDRKVRVNALIDTGNRLKDPITGSPVIVLEYSAISGILPRSVREAFMAYERGDIASVSERIIGSSWSSRFRVIPFATIGKDKGMLIGFRADEVTIIEGKKGPSTRNAVVGIHMQRLSPEGSFKALLHPEILKQAS